MSDMIRWADANQYEAEPNDGKIRVRLLQAPADPLGSIAAMCRMYKGKPTLDLSEISDDERREYWEDIMKSHLLAPLESVSLHFYIEGVDRAFTHQMVRQRTAAYAQESMRFAVVNDATVQSPISIRAGSDEAKIWEETVARIQWAYQALVNSGVPAEDARGLLPHATPTRIHYVTNLRALLEHAGNRLCTQAQFVWRLVFLSIMDRMQRASPGWQWDLITNHPEAFRPVCFSLGECPFKATFDRDCSIRDRVDAGRFDEIEPKEWMLDPEAARRKFGESGESR